MTNKELIKAVRENPKFVLDILCVGKKLLLNLCNRLEAADAVIEKLPKTADGVAIIPMTGTLVYSVRDDFVDSEGNIIGHTPSYWGGKWMVFNVPVSECYSTREAAETIAQADQAAKEEGE